MKKLIFIYAALIVAVVMLAFFQRGSLNILTFGKTPQVTIKNATYNVTLAKSEKEKMLGLSGKKSLGANQGMLFIFDHKDSYGFWMRKMRFPIDIIYINDGKVVDIIENAEAPQDPNSEDTSLLKIYKPKAEANYVLEINAGSAAKHKFKEGDTVKFKNI